MFLFGRQYVLTEHREGLWIELIHVSLWDTRPVVSVTYRSSDRWDDVPDGFSVQVRFGALRYSQLGVYDDPARRPSGSGRTAVCGRRL